MSEAQGFGQATGGNVAVLFALSLAPLLVAGGAGFDYARAIQARAAAQEAADGALLRVARLHADNPSLTDADLTKAARGIFDKATEKHAHLSVSDFAVSYDPKTKAYAVAMNAVLPTALVKIAGFKELTAPVRAEVKLGAPPYIEVVMALDNTGSMNDNGKIDALKKSASALVDSLFASGAEVKIGLVPFGQYVNVGAANAGAAWLEAAPAGWEGCVGSRNYPLNTEDGSYATRVPTVAGSLCPSAIQPLTDDKAAILSAIDGMKGVGWTYIAEGVAWGRRVMSEQAPFTGGLSAAEVKKRDGIKALIVLTDGMNTRAPTYPLHDSADTASADALTARLCEEAKKDGLVVYSIAFDVSDPGVQKLLEGCSATPGHYFEPTSASGLSAAFDKIAKNLRTLSLSK
jgi:Flp pilus assembly protein TadG